LLCEDPAVSERANAKTPLILCLIGQGKFVEAMNTIAKGTPAPAAMVVEDAFNYGMAAWGASGKIPMDYFNRVVECDIQNKLDKSPNRLQCSCLAYWAIGNIKEAKYRLEEARVMIDSRPQSDFSAWRYLQVTPREFKKDLDEMQSLFEGAAALPEVLGISPEGAVSK
jgi:hypothetical protein